jgi:2-dehydro-3-deoxygalactonokinase
MVGFLACDWGTTNLRAWRLDGTGKVVAERDFPFGVSRLKRGEAATLFAEEVRPAMEAQDLPALLCGMIGSNLGWTVVPYLNLPSRLSDLKAALHRVEGEGAPVRIVPGLRGEGLGAPEVMRGEETQLFGWLALDPARVQGRHVVCHPGTHAKWAVLENGAVTRFLTAMTGELFDVLGKHSVLRWDGPADDEDAFREGLSAAGEGDALSSRLFTARTRVVAGDASAETTPSYLSGLLIGAEVASLPRLLGLEPGADIALVGDPALCRWYEIALRHRGFAPSVQDGERAAIAGLLALQDGVL